MASHEQSRRAGEDPKDTRPRRRTRLGRRDLIKLGAGVVLTGIPTSASAQAELPQTAPAAGNPTSWPPPVRTRAGYVYTANRLGNNGPMDDTSRKIVKYVSEYSAAQLTASEIDALNKIVLDTIACAIAGFEEEPVRICAKLARQARPDDVRCTVFGYGISTTPELAAFANSALVRAMDFNDTGGGPGFGQAGHPSDLIPAPLAIGEALHSTGLDVLAAIKIGYELRAGSAGGEAVAAAMAAGKLMGLDQDRLANALTLALRPHVPLNKGVGAMSMWKGVRSAEAVKCGVWGALMAREGLTGPPQPFEGRGGRWAVFGAAERDLTLPSSPDTLQRNGYKRYPSEASSQAFLDLIPEMRAWTKPDDIEWIHHEVPFGVWEEIADSPKWDPRNRETADHSAPYILARALLDGEIYLDSFTEQKYMDPAVRALMARISCSPVAGWSGNSPARITVRKRTGQGRVWDVQGGRRRAPRGELLEKPSVSHRLTNEEIAHKFDRVCAFRGVSNEQRDRARSVWSNLRTVKDIADAMQTLAKFGRPQAL